jgi:hypothetical protein
MVHEEAIANQSAALNSLMRGKMSESTAGVAAWIDVDEATFVRFAQFAYTGDYSVPKMVVSGQERSKSRQEQSVAEVEEIEELGIEENYWGSLSSASKKNKKKSQVTCTPPQPTPTPFKSLTYTLLQPRSKFANTCDPAVMEGSEENITEALLSHASLYILAEKWGIESLKRLTLSKLHQTLNLLTLDAARVPHIVKLVRCAYSGTPDLETGIDELRELVCRYVAVYIRTISEHTEFEELIEEGGAFMRDLWKRVLVRIG